MRRATLAIIVLGFFALSLPAVAIDMPQSYQRGLWETTLDGSYFASTGNYIQGSGFQQLPSGDKFDVFTSNLNTRYVLAPNFTLFGGVQGSYAESNSFGVNKTGSGINSGTAGAQFPLLLGSFQFVPEVSFLFPIAKNSDTGAVMRSEGVSEDTVMFRAQIPLQAFTAFGHIGYDARGGGRSTLLPWGLGADFNFGSVHVGGSVFGFNSISDDADKGTAELARDLQINLVNGGAMEFTSVNPSVIDSEIYLLFAMSRSFRFAVGGGGVLSGSNISSGYHGEASLIYRFSTAPARHNNPHDTGVSKDPYVDDFREDTNDGVDQKLFKPLPKPRPVNRQQQRQAPPTTTTMPPPINPDEQQSATVTPQEAEVTHSVELKEQTQKELDNAEMSIELRTEKKRKAKKKSN